MRKGNSSTYLPPPPVIGFVVEAFMEYGHAGDVLALFDRMRAQVCDGSIDTMGFSLIRVCAENGAVVAPASRSLVSKLALSPARLKRSFPA